MSHDKLYQLERKGNLMSIESQAIKHQAYILDEDRQGLVIGVGEIKMSNFNGSLLLGLTKNQVIELAYELLEIADMYLEDDDG